MLTSEKAEAATPGAEPSLKRKTFAAVGWNIGLMGSQYGFRLASNLIMTRLLLPEAWGLLSFATAVMTALTLFTDIGINQSVVREPDGDQPHFLRVAWTLKIIRSLVVCVAVILMACMLGLIAPHFAPPGSVYADPRMPWLIGLTTITTLAQGIESSNKDTSIRHMNYQRYTLMIVGCQALSILTMIVFALIHPSVWALIAGMISNSIYVCILSHVVLPGPKMKLAWDPEVVSRLWHFGKWIILSSSLSFVQATADQFLLGALLSATALGLYVIAQIWVGSVRNIVGLLGVRIVSPAINQVIRTRPQDLPRVYRRFQSAVDAMCAGGFLCLFFGGNLLITLLYTSKYHDAAHFLVLMSTYVLASRFETYNNLLLSLGKSRATTVMAFIRAASLCTLLPLASLLISIDAAMMVIALIPLVAAPYALKQLGPVLGRTQIRIEIAWIALTLVAATVVFIRVSILGA